MKTCAGCREAKSLTEFGRDKQKSDGLTSRCKPCRRVDGRQYAQTEAGRLSQQSRSRRFVEAHPDRVVAAKRSWRERHPDYSAETNRLWRRENPQRVLESSHRRRVRVRESTVGSIDLAALWVASRGLCGICLEPLDAGLRYPHPSSVSLDHIVPLSKGGTHEQSNLQWAHLVCNTRKGAKVARRPIQQEE